MIRPFRYLGVLAASMTLVGRLGAAEATLPSWHATSIPQALLYVVLFSLVGVLTAIIAYKLFDFCTPGKLHEEIIAQKNVAAAIIGAAVILGVCIIIAASILG